jgi:nucleoporin NUP159
MLHAKLAERVDWSPGHQERVVFAEDAELQRYKMASDTWDKSGSGRVHVLLDTATEFKRIVVSGAAGDALLANFLVQPSVGINVKLLNRNTACMMWVPVVVYEAQRADESSGGEEGYFLCLDFSQPAQAQSFHEEYSKAEDEMTLLLKKKKSSSVSSSSGSKQQEGGETAWAAGAVAFSGTPSGAPPAATGGPNKPGLSFGGSEANKAETGTAAGQSFAFGGGAPNEEQSSSPSKDDGGSSAFSFGGDASASETKTAGAWTSTVDSAVATATPGSVASQLANSDFSTPGPSAATPAFGAPLSDSGAVPAFGAPVTDSGADAFTSKFGGASGIDSTPAFGAPVADSTPAFGAPATDSTPAFGAPATDSTQAFVAPAGAAAAFTPAFGGAPAVDSGLAFGAPAASIAPAEAENPYSPSAFAARLAEFYQKNNPEKLKSVPKLLKKYAGRFHELSKKFGDKYPGAWEHILPTSAPAGGASNAPAVVSFEGGGGGGGGGDTGVAGVSFGGFGISDNKGQGNANMFGGGNATATGASNAGAAGGFGFGNASKTPSAFSFGGGGNDAGSVAISAPAFQSPADPAAAATLAAARGQSAFGGSAFGASENAAPVFGGGAFGGGAFGSSEDGDGGGAAAAPAFGKVSAFGSSTASAVSFGTTGGDSDSGGGGFASYAAKGAVFGFDSPSATT